MSVYRSTSLMVRIRGENEQGFSLAFIRFMMVIGTAYIGSVFAGELSMLQHSMNDLDFLISH